MKLRTWHIELFIVWIILCTITAIWAHNWINWITTLAVMFTFQHAQIADRLAERQAILDKPTVECYYKLNRLFAAKEVTWIVAFILMKNYAAIVGSFLFAMYPLWRKLYRTRIKPL